MPLQPPEPINADEAREAYYDLTRNQIDKLAELIVDDTLCPTIHSPEVSPTNRWAWERRVEHSLRNFTSPETLAHIAHGWGLVPNYESFVQDWTERQAEAAWEAKQR